MPSPVFSSKLLVVVVVVVVFSLVSLVSLVVVVVVVVVSLVSLAPVARPRQHVLVLRRLFDGQTKLLVFGTVFGSPGRERDPVLSTSWVS